MLTVQINVALQSQKPQGLIGSESPGRPSRTFTQLLSFEEVLQVNVLLNVHRNHKAY